MNSKRIIFICILLHVLATGFLYVTKVVLATEKISFEELLEKENIRTKDERSTLRAFYTSPPVTPHEIETEEFKDCLKCHLNVTRLDDGRVAKQTPHPQFSNCLQCHVSGQEKVYDQEATDWKGLKEPKRGDRWSIMSPPTVPHRIRLRENCLSCHGPKSPDMRLRTTHPKRTSCLQCHVPNNNNEFETE